MNTSHTPTPWEATFFKATNGDLCPGIKSRPGKAIAWVAGESVDQQDAAFIVRAVNAHDGLLAALQEALPYLDELYKINTYAGVTATKMRAAIAKATS